MYLPFPDIADWNATLSIAKTTKKSWARWDNSLLPALIIDPAQIDKIIADLETEIEDFSANIDFVLSESNAITQIVV